ncbi:hypothetical protein ZOSMA_238G00100 [Zostera marina]|uniref:Uncharacterized protein n=1 Tax=Zostera marina TaxID=29655 RepID=A0A0K9PJW7_ZOSMR|nr:hypothetical protein ZOSMA_238G00100 [Zostera marina]
MGCRYSRSSEEPPAINGARVVDVTGYVEEFVCADNRITPESLPVKVSDLTGTPPKMVLCLLAPQYSVGFKPLHLQEHLQSNRLYFLLPKSVFDDDVTLLDQVVLARKLSAVAYDSKTEIETRVVGTASGISNGIGMNQCRFRDENPTPMGLLRQGSLWKPDLEPIKEAPESSSSELISIN